MRSKQKVERPTNDMGQGSFAGAAEARKPVASAARKRDADAKSNRRAAANRKRPGKKPTWAKVDYTPPTS